MSAVTANSGSGLRVARRRGGDELAAGLFDEAAKRVDVSGGGFGVVAHDHVPVTDDVREVLGRRGLVRLDARCPLGRGVRRGRLAVAARREGDDRRGDESGRHERAEHRTDCDRAGRDSPRDDPADADDDRQRDELADLDADVEQDDASDKPIVGRPRSCRRVESPRPWISPKANTAASNGRRSVGRPRNPTTPTNTTLSAMTGSPSR